MTYQQTIAILMALAPATPRSFEHAPAPEEPLGADYLEDVKSDAAAYSYSDDDGNDITLLAEARFLIEWFCDGGGSAPMDAAPAIEEAVARVVDQHRGMVEDKLRETGKRLVDALNRFAADYDEYLSANDEWERQREMAWRSQWAHSIDAASRP